MDAARALQPNLGSAVPNRAAVAQQFREMTFQGATGAISFQNSRIANNRSLAILTIADISDVENGVLTCSYLIGDLSSPDQPRQSNGCPVPG